MKTLTFPACNMSDYITDEFGDATDLDSSIHKGFTVGSGKTIWWYFIWHPSGNASIYRETTNGLIRGYIKNEQQITVHFI